MEKFQRKDYKNAKGITLIALVITIITLLILAGVSISAITGNEGIMSKAKQAKESTEAAEEYEKVQMATIQAMAESGAGSVTNTNDLLKNKLLAMGLDITTFGTSANDSWKIQGANGQWYQIFANGQVTKPNEEPADVTVALEGITISNNPTSASILVGGTVQINAAPTNPSTTESLTYTSSNPSVASVTSTGLVTGEAASNDPVTITVAGSESTSVTATFTVTVSNPAPTITISTSHSVRNLTTAGLTWEKLSELSGIISDNEGSGENQINNDTMEVTITQSGTPYVLGIGDTATVTYSGTAKTVRIIGFNHDRLASNSSKKAGITFDFENCMVDGAQMNSSSTNSGGWGVCALKSTLNGTYLTSLKDNNNTTAMSTYIKPVLKDYIPTYNTASLSSTPSTDSLWLLACSEIWNNGYSGSGTYGYCRTKEGEQYKYYKNINATYSSSNSSLVKKDSSSSAKIWWLRSPYYVNGYHFCHVNPDSTCGNNAAIYSSGVAPGFAI